MTKQEMITLARGNVESHLGDLDDPDDIYEEVYTLAVDALLDAGVDHTTAGRIANEIAMCYAND